MTIREFALAVKDMRDAQNKYFRYRGLDALKKSKSLEKIVDQLVQTILQDTNAQPQTTQMRLQ